jgi:competence protein ComEC
MLDVRSAALLLSTVGLGTVGLSLLSGCGPKKEAETQKKTTDGVVSGEQCPAGRPMRVHFYDVAQGLAVLVTLPDGRQILVDTADAPNRPGCSLLCAEANQHLLAGLSKEAKDGSIGMLWITHQHSDHIGGAISVLERLKVERFVDNGRDLVKPMIEKVHTEAEAMSAKVSTVDPQHAAIPMEGGAGVTLTAIVPETWPDSCGQNPNDCSIGLRVDYCKSSVLFTGDAEAALEAAIDPKGPVTLLQVAHHGSDTSSSKGFLDKAQPKFAVISSGKPNSGLNQTYCHPRKSAVDRLTSALGGPGQKTIEAFDGASCKEGGQWTGVRASDRLWSTARDGDVVLMTTGNGDLVRE